MEYLVDGAKFSLSYQELRQKHIELCDMSDAEFMDHIPEAAHLACVICFLKETPTYICLSDKGIVHELIHLMHIPQDAEKRLPEIRDTFTKRLKLS